jgi:hypothetical protein
MKAKNIRTMSADVKGSVHADSTDLSVLGGQVQVYSDQDFDAVAKGGDFLPRLQLMISQSQPCKDGSFPVNHYALVEGQQNTDLGDAVDILPICWRPKALKIDGESVLTFYDPAAVEFKDIQAQSAETDSGCMYGPEFLVWIPSVKKLATFFFGSKSSRREAPNLRARLQQAATAKSKKIETTKYTWFAPVITGCSTPIEPPPPDQMEGIKEEVAKFNNPPKSNVEKADAPATTRER